MKKNFVKKTLASTLALAMVATSMPAAFTTASAAKAPALNKTSKTLYINENAVGNSFAFNIKNKVSGSKYAWTTSNKAIAKVNSKGLTTPGTKTGKATISCKITLPTKKTKTLKATVTVKENASKVVIKNAPENNTVGIGENVFDFDSTMSSASGAKATDYRTWEIDKDSNTAGATIDAKSGKVTTTKAGEFKVRVRAYQNKAKLAKNDTVDSEWLTVKVVASLKSVAQTTTTKVALTFDDNMKETVKKADFSIKNKVTNVVSAIKGIEFSEDGKVVTVETFSNFVDAGSYVLTYGDVEKEFQTSIGTVESIEIKTTKVNTNEETEIKYVLKNANGVDITTVATGSVTIEAVENNNGFFGNNKLTLFTKGSTAKIKATYHTYEWDEKGNETGVRTAEAVITAVDKTSATIGNYKNYVIASQKPDWTKVTANKNVIYVNDTKAMNLYINALDSENKEVDGLTFKSGNDNVLLVADSDGVAALKAVNEGSTVVNVYKDKTLLWSLPVVVKAERKASSVNLASTSFTVSHANAENNEIKLTVKDQYTEELEITKSKLNEITAKNQAALDLVSKKEFNLDDFVSYKTDKKGVVTAVVVNGSKAPAGTYQFSISVLDNASAQSVLTIKVVEAAQGATVAIAFQNATTSVDTTISADTDLTAKKLVVTNKLYEKDANGVVSGAAINAKVTVTDPSGNKTVVGTTGDADKAHFTFDKGVLSFNYAVVSGNSIVKAKTGSYRIDAELTVGASVKRTVSYMTVTDNQVAPTVVVKSNKAATIDTIVNQIEVNNNKDNKYSVTLDLDKQVTKNGNSVYVKEVTVVEKFGENQINHTVKVGVTFTTAN